MAQRGTHTPLNKLSSPCYIRTWAFLLRCMCCVLVQKASLCGKLTSVLLFYCGFYLKDWATAVITKHPIHRENVFMKRGQLLIKLETNKNQILTQLQQKPSSTAAGCLLGNSTPCPSAAYAELFAKVSLMSTSMIP